MVPRGAIEINEVAMQLIELAQAAYEAAQDANLAPIQTFVKVTTAVCNERLDHNKQISPLRDSISECTSLLKEYFSAFGTMLPDGLDAADADVALTTLEGFLPPKEDLNSFENLKRDAEYLDHLARGLADGSFSTAEDDDDWADLTDRLEELVFTAPLDIELGALAELELTLIG
jgi:hypothetical protein